MPFVMTQESKLAGHLISADAPPSDGIGPVSLIQEPLWVRDQAGSSDARDRLMYAFRLTAAVDPGLLEASLHLAVNGHPALRTRFLLNEHGSGKGPRRLVQILTQEARVPWIVLPSDAGSEALLTGERESAFDLSQGHLVRASSLELAGGDRLVVLNVHRIAGDRKSLEILLADWSACYDAVCTGKTHELPPLPQTYADFSRHQRQTLTDEAVERQLKYWKDRLAGPLPVIELPADRPRAAAKTFRGASCGLVLPAALTADLRNLARNENTSLKNVCLGALEVLLLRYAGTEDVLLATRADLRKPAGCEGVIGPFENQLLQRTDLSGDPDFREVLKRVRQTVAEAEANQDVPSEMVLEAAQPELYRSGAPAHRVEFDWLDEAPPEFRFAGEIATPVPVDGTAEVAFSLWEDSEAVRGNIVYDSELFDAATIENLTSHFETLLTAIARSPGEKVAALPILSEAEQHRLLVEWNDTQALYPEDRCIHQLFEEQARRTPHAPAVSFKRTSLTYEELNARANQLAHHLQSLGAGPEVLIGICAERSLEMVVGLLGIMKAGAAYVPLDSELPPERLGFMLEDTGVTVVLTQAHLLDRLPAHAATVLCLDSDWGRISQASSTDLESGVAPDNLAYVIYTSGSTGRPKGVMVPHRGVVNRLHWGQQQYPLTAADSVLQKTPYSFDVSVWEFFWPLICGARLVMAEARGHRNPAYLAGLIRDAKVTTLHFVPTMLDRFLEDAPLEDCASVRQVMCSGEALPAELAERFHRRWGCALYNLYGPTEGSIEVTAWTCAPGAKVIPIGRPIANIQMYILDDARRPVPAGATGELYIGGVGVARGYWNRADLTAESFVVDPFSTRPGARLYRTGDLARFLRNGEIEYLGRVDHQVKIRGFRIEPGEIESALADYPGVAENVVALWEDASRGKRLVAYVVPTAGAELNINELRRFLKEKLPDYMVPSAFVMLDGLPTTLSGKTDRRALPPPPHDRPQLEKEYVAPRNPVERRLVAVWEDVLGVRPIGVTDNYFDLGAESLTTARAFARIAKEFGKSIPPTVLFKAPTVELLAESLNDIADTSERACLVPIQTEGSKPPLFCIHGGAGTVLFFYNLAKHLGGGHPIYALQARGLYGDAPPDTRVEQMAERYVREIRGIQKTGPYYLIGYCFGAVIAFEMARRLLAAGEEVALLASLNGARPRYANGPTEWGLSAAPKGLRGLAGAHLRDLLYKWKRWRARYYISRNRPIPDRLRDEYFVIGSFRAEREYHAKPYSGKMILFRARGLYYDPCLGWNELVSGGLEVHEIPGDHRSHRALMEEPLVGVLAEGIRRALDQADTGAVA